MRFRRGNDRSETTHPSRILNYGPRVLWTEEERARAKEITAELYRKLDGLVSAVPARKTDAPDLKPNGHERMCECMECWRLWPR